MQRCEEYYLDDPEQFLYFLLHLILYSYSVYRKAKTYPTMYDYIKKRNFKYNRLKYFSKCLTLGRMIIPETLNLIHRKPNA